MAKKQQKKKSATTGKRNEKKRPVSKAKGKSAKAVKAPKSRSVSKNAGRDKRKKSNPEKVKRQNVTASIVRKYRDKKGIIRLRDQNGRYLEKEVQEAILKFSRHLDSKRVKFTYQELLEVPRIKDMMLVIEDVEPKELFYWNALSLIDQGNKKALTSEKTRKYVIHSPTGRTIETNSNERAANLLMRYNKVLETAEELAEEETGSNPYLTVGVKFTENINSEILKVEVDYTYIGSRIPVEETEDYLTRAVQGEKPKKKRKASARGAKTKKAAAKKKAPAKSGRRLPGKKSKKRAGKKR